MADINVLAHGVNPETGDYLSPEERKALFKRQKMGSKIDPSVFRTGIISGKKSGGAGGGAIVPFQQKPQTSAGAIVKVAEQPQQQTVQAQTVQPKKDKVTEQGKEFVKGLKDLFKTTTKVLKIKKSKKKFTDTLTALKTKRSKTKKKKDKKTKESRGKDVFGIGRKITRSATNFFGDIFGIFGDILAFAALDWISKPENKETVKKFVEIFQNVIKFIDSFVTTQIDLILGGFSDLVGDGNSAGTRIGGFLKLTAAFFTLRWLLNPLKMIKDLNRVFKNLTKFGKFINKTLAKPIKMVQDFVEKFIKKGLSAIFKRNIFKPFKTLIGKVGGKSLIGFFKFAGRGFTKIISRIPILGALLDFALNVFVFKESPGRSAFKAIGAALLAVIGSAIGPVGTILGGISGDWAGGVLYDVFFGGKKPSGEEPGNETPSQRRRNSRTGRTGSRSTPGNTSSSAGQWKPILELIAAHESVGGSYDSAYPSTTKVKYSGGKPLYEMTISEADAWQAKTYRARGSAAAGRYQFMNIKKQAADANVGPNEIFSPENQDKMAISLLTKKREITLDMIKNNPDEAMIRLGMEWAAIPMPKRMKGAKRIVNAGQSYYAGDGRNKAGATVEEVRSAFAKVGGGSQQKTTTQPQMSSQAKQIQDTGTYTVGDVTYDVKTGAPVSSTPAAQITPSPSTEKSSVVTEMSREQSINRKVSTVQRSGGTSLILTANNTSAVNVTSMDLNSPSIFSTQILNRL